MSDVTSQAEGSESVEVEGVVVSAEKIDLSPESSDRSFSDPQSSTDRVGDIHILEVTNNLEHKSTFSISNFLIMFSSAAAILGDMGYERGQENQRS